MLRRLFSRYNHLQIPLLMKDFVAFLRALVRHWIALVTSSLLAAALAVAAAWGVPIPKLVVQAVILLAVVPAAFYAWRDERREKKKLARELVAERETAHRLAEEDGLALQVSALEYWVLLTAAKYGLNEYIGPVRRGQVTGGAIALGDTPIEHEDSPWLRETVYGLLKRGALEIAGKGAYRPSEGGWRAIRAGRRQGRKVEVPAKLIDARTGEIVTLPL